jgi:CubicO group peptidase (beta-lactamase class C family)
MHRPTVRNLLTHTGGTPLLAQFEHWKIDSLPLSAKVDAFSLEPLEFEPDTKWSYSNEGFETAARMIEVISGMPFEDFMRRRLFDPLGMSDTGYLPTEDQESRLAKGYKPNAAGNDFEEVPVFLLQYPLVNNPKRFASSSGGGLFSTGPDLARFCRMLLNRGVLEGKRYLSEAAFQEMTRKQVRPDLLENGKLPGDTGWDNYGLGWGLVGQTYQHLGAYGTDIKIDPQKGIALIWLVQTPDPTGVGRSARIAFEKMIEASPEEKRRSTDRHLTE